MLAGVNGRRDELYAKRTSVITPDPAHVNISAGGVAKYAKNKAEAIKLLEFLASPDGSKGLANPIATFLSFAMALKYSLNLDKEAKELENAVQKVLNDGLRTKDILSKGNKEVSTKVMGDAVIAYLQK